MNKWSRLAMAGALALALAAIGCRDQEGSSGSSALDSKPLSDNSNKPKTEAGGAIPDLDVRPAPEGVKTGTP